jgi:hypothetical protein
MRDTKNMKKEEGLLEGLKSIFFTKNVFRLVYMFF